MPRIFISYRHTDKQVTLRIFEQLEKAFPHSVFLDEKIPPGHDFVKYLTTQISSTDILLVVITEGWAAKLEQQNDPDWVRFEIEEAFRQQKRVVPVLIGTTPWPDNLGLKGKIWDDFLRLQATSVRDNLYLSVDMRELIRKLRETKQTQAHNYSLKQDRFKTRHEREQELTRRTYIAMGCVTGIAILIGLIAFVQDRIRGINNEPPDPTTIADTQSTSFPSPDSFLPLAVGNTWTYEKNIYAGKNPAFWLSMPALDGSQLEAIPSDYPCDPGTYTETYTVNRQVNISTWEIGIALDDKCQGIYQHAQQILWTVVFDSNPEITRIAATATEQISYDTQEPPPGFGIRSWPNNIFSPPRHERVFLEVVPPTDEGTIVLQDNGTIAFVYHGGGLSSSAVPAGSFDQCIPRVDDVSPEIAAGVEENFQQGYSEVNVFCAGVGLVSRVQRDRTDEVIYQMNLIEYHLVSDAQSQITTDSEKIAFVSDRDTNQNWEIYSMNPDGSEQTNLTNHLSQDAAPAWSPNHQQIAFSTDRDGNFEIYTMNGDGSDPTRLTNNTDVDTCPSWSPDGTQIVFSSEHESNDDIYVINVDGTGLTRLTASLADDTCPSWSSDGRIAFTSLRDSNYEIYVMNADGSNQQRITNTLGRENLPRWSPNGSQLLYISDQNIVVSNGSGSNGDQLTSSSDVYVADWSPNGESIAFMSGESGSLEIYTMTMEGSNKRRLTNNPASAYEGDPSW